jgi:TRAP-type C4-dicarboxylate transport system permease small subunit
LERSPQRSWRTRAAELARRTETAAIAVLLSALILLASAQIVLRNVFSIGVTWADGLTRLLVLWIALIGAMAAARDGRHIRMGALVTWLPQRLQRAAEVTVDLVAAVVSGLLSWYAWVFVRDSRAFGDVVLTGIPAWTVQLIMPVAFALISYRYVLRAIRQVRQN